ncbi:hypothetical protein [Acholeplasma laidlawii]|nr:hypothetical protein QOL21_01005 [Acholeplasma laidlawii]
MIKTAETKKRTYECPVIEVVKFEENVRTGSEGSANVSDWWFEG